MSKSSQLAEDTLYQKLFRQESKYLWGLCYRMTGSRADAEDLLQETFVKALEKPPADTQRQMRPWLTKVAMNLSRDRLRRRKTRDYVGPWLPEPVTLDSSGWASASHSELSEGTFTSPEAEYSAFQSASLAFLHALEVLSPNQRAVLVLRDILDLSVKETAEALELGLPSVKTTHHRAKKILAEHHQPQNVPSADLAQKVWAEFLGALGENNLEKMKALLAAEVTTYSDAGGHYHAALRPIQGMEKVLRFIRSLVDKFGLPDQVTPIQLNGQLAMLTSQTSDQPNVASKRVFMVDFDEEQKIRDIYIVLNPEKLAGLPWPV